jgi:hypothetical protein
MGASWIAELVIGGAGSGKTKFPTACCEIDDFEAANPGTYGTMTSRSKKMIGPFRRILWSIYSALFPLRNIGEEELKTSFHKLLDA